MSENPSTYFPDVDFSWDVADDYETHVEVEKSDYGTEQRMDFYPSGSYRLVTGTTSWLSQAQVQTIRDFLIARRFMVQPFWFFHPASEQWSAFPVGTGNGSATTFIMPLKASAITAVYVNGVSKAFTIQVGIGSGGEDQVTISPAPGNGLAITVDGIFRERMVVRWNGTAVPRSYPNEMAGLRQYKVSLREVK